jgi:hypothetical protein
MAMGEKSGKMALITKEHLTRDLSMGRGSIDGKMGLLTAELGFTIT